MANETVTLLRYAKLPGLGWRRGRAVLGKTGKLAPDYMYVGTRNHLKKVHAPDGHYELRYFEGKLPRYKDVGNDPTQALEELKLAQKQLQLKNSAEDVGYIFPKIREEKPKSMAEYAKEFLELKSSPSLKLSQDAIHLYRSVVEEFLRVCRKHKKHLPKDITEADVIAFCDALNERLSDRTRATHYTSLRGFLFFCGLEPKRLITASVHKRLKSFEKRKVRIYSATELTTLLSICDPYHHVMFMLALLSGMRDRELAHVLWRQVDFDASVIHLEDYEIHHKGKLINFALKDGEARDIPLFPAQRAELLRWRKSRPNAVFVVGTRNDRPNVRILDALKRKVRKAGLNCGLCYGCASRKECHRFHVHYFRSSFASYALKRNDIRKVQEWMGHSDLATLAKYVGLADNCPKWLAELYVLPSTDEDEQNATVPDSVLSWKSVSTAVQ